MLVGFAIVAPLTAAQGVPSGIGSDEIFWLVLTGAGNVGGHLLRASVLAGAAALCFGSGLYATGRVSEALPIAWALIPPRLIGVVTVALPLIASRRLQLTRAAAPFVVASGLAEVGGFTSYAVGARHGIAIAAVLASQFAALAALGAYVLFHERLSRIQVAGVVAIAAGVAVLSALQ